MTASRYFAVLLLVACGDSGSRGGPSTGSADAAATGVDAGGETDGGGETDSGGEPTVVTFDNADGTFVWEPKCNCVEETTGAYLDVTKAPDQQTGDPAPTGILLSIVDSAIGNITPGSYVFRGDQSDDGLEVARGESFVIPGQFEETTLTVYPPLAKAVGDSFGPDDDSWGSVKAAHFQDLSDEYGPTQIWFHDGIIGVRFTADDGLHYGFVELDQVGTEYSDDYRPIRWGYNPLPDQPLVIPP